MPASTITFSLNGKDVTCDVPEGATLLELLRRDFLLTGTKEGCSMGECGACTVLVNGEPVTSCLMMGAQADGTRVVTIEGLSNGPDLHPVQQGFIEEGGVQCGFCTPGMVMAAAALLERTPDPTVSEINCGISGNLCRCTGYAKIIRAIQTAARLRREQAQQATTAGGGR